MTIDLIQATRLVGPEVARTALAQIKKKKPSRTDSSVDKARQEPPSDEAVYQASIRLMCNLFKVVLTSTVEDMHAISNRHAPPPPNVLVQDVIVPLKFYDWAAKLIQTQLGPNLDKVGRTWWQWREPNSMPRAQWMEKKTDAKSRRARREGEGKKILFYVHGGAYYLGGVGHDAQIQRHARKLKGRCFAPRYRLAPQFPFPCAVQDIVSAYLYLLTVVDASHVVIGGDSAGGGLCLALLQILRDQHLPLPAGATLVSPWVDLTHSFPSITQPTDYDYVPVTGFHAKPSLSWPPPTPAEMRALKLPQNTSLGPDYEVSLDGEPYRITDQINMYAPNLQLVYPLVSPIHAATLGGFCPVQVIVGGGEVLRDEQIYLAHKMAHPEQFPLSEEMVRMNGEDPARQNAFPPTDVELLVFDDGPHAAPILGHIDVAKYEHRAIARFAGWALARAQGTSVEIKAPPSLGPDGSGRIGAGEELPPFEGHMRRYRVDRSGRLYDMEPPEMLPALQVPLDEVGVPKGETLKGWIKYRDELEKKFASKKQKVFEKRMANAKRGYVPLPPGEIPPPSALVGRRVIGKGLERETTSSGLGNSVLSRLFGRVEKGGPAAESGREDTGVSLMDTEVQPDHVVPTAH